MIQCILKYTITLFACTLTVSSIIAQNSYKLKDISNLQLEIKKAKTLKNYNSEFKYRQLLVAEYLNIPNYPLAKRQMDTLHSILDKSNELNRYLLLALEADYYKYLGNSDIALQKYLIVYDYFSKNSDKDLHFKSCIDLIEHYRKIADLKRAKSFADSANKVLAKNSIKDTNLIIRYYGRIAAVKNETETSDSAIFYSKKALRYAMLINNKYAMANSYNELAYSYCNRKLLDTAIKYYKEAEDIWFSLNANREAINAFFGRLELISNNYPSVKIKKQNIEQYKVLLKKIEGINNDGNFDIGRIYLNMAADSRYIGDSVSYYKYTYLNYEYRFNNQVMNNKAEVKEVIEKYENEKIRAENTSIGEKLEANAAILESERSKNILFIVLLSLASLFILVVAIFYYLKQKANKQLTHTLSKLEEKNVIIEQKSKELAESLDERELLLKEIHHRVKNNLQVISGLLELQKEELTEEGSKAAFDEGQSRVRSIALIHQNLYQHENLSGIEFQVFVAELTSNVKEVFEHLDCKMDINIDVPNNLIDIDTAIPLGLIINELLTNSYKYATTKGAIGKISIQLINKQDGNYQLIYSDSGPGINKDVDFSQASSLGLRLIKGLSAQLAGEASYSNNGLSTFTINFKDTSARQRDE